MPSTFRTCNHRNEIDSPVNDWRECWACIDEVTMQLAIARTYLTEIAEGKFNDNGDCYEPISEPVRGRHFQQIARTGLGAIV